MAGNTTIVPSERVLRLILLIHGQKVILDADMAALFGVETRVLVQAVKRNLERFPSDFMFPLSDEEFRDLRSQSVTSSSQGGRCSGLLARKSQRGAGFPHRCPKAHKAVESFRSRMAGQEQNCEEHHDTGRDLRDSAVAIQRRDY